MSALLEHHAGPCADTHSNCGNSMMRARLPGQREVGGHGALPVHSTSEHVHRLHTNNPLPPNHRTGKEPSNLKSSAHKLRAHKFHVGRAATAAVGTL